jgi:hypothetical protein
MPAPTGLPSSFVLPASVSPTGVAVQLNWVDDAQDGYGGFGGWVNDPSYDYASCDTPNAMDEVGIIPFAYQGKFTSPWGLIAVAMTDNPNGDGSGGLWADAGYTLANGVFTFNASDPGNNFGAGRDFPAWTPATSFSPSAISIVGTLLGQIGKCIKWINLLIAYQNTLLGSGTGVDEILSQYESERYLVIGIEQQWLGQASQVAGWAATLKATIDATLSNLQLDLNAPNSNVSTILPLLVDYLVANSQTVLANTISTPTVTPSGANAGSGVLVASCNNVAGVADQRIITETVQLTCTRDRFSGAQAGGEQFSVVGYPTVNVYSNGILGNGTGAPVNVADNQNILKNGAFTSFSGSTPNNWTVNAGAADISQELTNVHVVGGAALKYAGDGTTTVVQVTQTIGGYNAINTQTIYAVGVWLRIGGTVNTGSNLQVAVTGTGFTTVNLFNADPHTLTTSYQLFNVFLPIGVSYPSNLAITVKWSSANTAGATAVVYIANIVLAKPTAFGIFGSTQLTCFRGSTDFLQGDSFTLTTANPNNGVWQSAMSRLYNVQLPSTTGTPTILDSLCE